MGSLPLFFRLVGASIGGQARYPASALMLTVGQVLGTGIEVIAVWALFHRFGDVQGWRIGEVALFYGLVNCMFALADALGRGFDVLGTEFLRTGAFDRLLLRPRPLALAQKLLWSPTNSRPLVSCPATLRSAVWARVISSARSMRLMA